MAPFLAIHVKGGQSISPKQKGPHHHLILKEFILKEFINWYDSQVDKFQIDILLCSKGEEK
jgi:hypothetical protein